VAAGLVIHAFANGKEVPINMVVASFIINIWEEGRPGFLKAKVAKK
jgi:hypothetical protein